jgi:hypothetical protein
MSCLIASRGDCGFWGVTIMYYIHWRYVPRLFRRLIEESNLISSVS